MLLYSLLQKKERGFYLGRNLEEWFFRLHCIEKIIFLLNEKKIFYFYYLGRSLEEWCYYTSSIMLSNVITLLSKMIYKIKRDNILTSPSIIYILNNIFFCNICFLISFSDNLHAFFTKNWTTNTLLIIALLNISIQIHEAKLVHRHISF